MNKFKLCRIKRLKRLNVLQDVTSFCQRLAYRRYYVSVSAFTRRKTLNISKSCRKPYKALYYIYTRCSIFNVFNVLLAESLTTRGLQRDVIKKANVLNVLLIRKSTSRPCYDYKTLYIKTNFIQL